MTYKQAVLMQRMWAEGKTAKAISLAIGVSISTVNSYMCNHRESFSKRRIRYQRNEDKRAKAKEMAARGYRVSEIARELGVVHTTASRYVRS